MEGNDTQVNMEISSRIKVLSRIRSGLSGSRNESVSGSESIAHKQDDLDKHQRGVPVHYDLGEEGRNPIDIYIDELGKVNGRSKVVKSEDELREYLSSTTIENDSKSFIAWETDLIKKLGVSEFLESRGLRLIKSDDKEELAKADIGITEADFAIADSGTLVLLSNPKKPRLTSLIAPIHIAILDSKRVLPNIFDLFQILRHKHGDELNSKDMMACIVFITGPSRTADIELNLTLGVHGPKQLHTLIYNDSSPQL